MKFNVLFFLFIVSIGLLVGSCKDNKHDSGSEYFYYPQKNVYYNTQTNHFYYSLDGAKTWDSLKNNAETSPATLGEKVVIKNEGEIFDDNESHRKLYAGTLFSFAGSEVAATAVPDVIEKKPAFKKGYVARKSSQEKPKKGIGGFFSKLFGKDKKK